MEKELVTIQCIDPLHHGGKRAAKKCSMQRCKDCCLKYMSDHPNLTCIYHTLPSVSGCRFPNEIRGIVVIKERLPLQ